MSTIVFPDRASARSGPAQQALTRAAAAAAKAPAVGGSRALRWRIAGERAELFVRAERPDPKLMIDAGSALHHALVALAGLGAVATCERLDDAAAEQPIAIVQLTGFTTATPEQVRSYQYISLPQPSARPGQPAITNQALLALQRAVAERGALLQLAPTGQRPELAHGTVVADPDTATGWLNVGEALSAVTLAGAMERLTVHASWSSAQGPATVLIR
ncbi:MAG TPA: hypothetical protein VFO77_13465, partial [Actinoplanes sp.]|nr:hypothetical protein [Actinoplanes sp.]